MYPLQLESPSYPPSPSNPSRSSQSDRLGSPCYITVSHQLSNLHMIVYICQCYSLDSSHPLLSPLCPEDCPLHLHLYSCPSNMFISTIFLNPIYIYILVYDTCFSLSVLLHSIEQALGSSTSIQMTHIHSSLWLSNILLYICTTTSLSIHLSMVIYVVSIS